MTFLKLCKYNKKLQERIGLSINDYKKYNQIEIELILKDDYNIELKKYPDSEYNKIINRIENKSFYHIYFDEGKEEINRDYLTQYDKVSKIKIILDMEITSLKNLFKDCHYIQEIKVSKFNRINILDMSSMFYNWRGNKLDISKLKTNNTTNLQNMFYNCFLEELDVSNFKTDKVINMSGMFECCRDLKKLDLSNFKTDNVKDMSCMFQFCSKLKELDISNFNAVNAEDMEKMFWDCCSLEKIDISKLNLTNKCIDSMFVFCSKNLIQMVKKQNPGLNEKAFEKY